MFGHKSLPALNWVYGGRPPVENLETVLALMKQANRYRNSLVHLERLRRKKLHRALLEICPELAELEKKAEELGERLEEIRKAINSARAAVRRRIDPEPLILKAQEIKAELKKIKPRREELRLPIYGSPGWYKEEKKAKEENRPMAPTLIPPDKRWVEVRTKIDGWAHDRLIYARAHSGINGVFGTYLMVEHSVKKTGFPPKYKGWHENGHLVIQIQKKKGKSFRTTDVFSGKDTRIQVEPLPEGAWKTVNGKIRPVRRLCRTRVHFRIGSQNGRKPLWTVVPIIMHRPFPEDAAITWVHLIRRRIGTNFEWKVQFSLSRRSGWAKEDAAPSGMVGIDIGWRIAQPGFPLRVAYWYGSDGRHGEVLLPVEWLAGMRKVEDIQGIRDTNFDVIRARLAPHLAALAAAGKLPDWTREAFENLAQWKSQARLARLMIRWRDNRFPCDEDSFSWAEEWRKRDCHLLNYENNLRDQLQNRRLDIFRNFAAEIRRQYRYVVLEKMDLRKFHTTAKPEEKKEDPATRQHNRDACVHLLRKCLEESVPEPVITVPPEFTTMRHHSCGSIEHWDHKELMHTCSKCGERYDQDETAARNILADGEKLVGMVPV